jgi:hypothetical protein
MTSGGGKPVSGSDEDIEVKGKRTDTEEGSGDTRADGSGDTRTSGDTQDPEV